MCGIAGWIDLERNLSNKRPIMNNMIDKLNNRGPDDEGIYSSRHALLGHRRLVVVDPSGGAQPMTRTFALAAYTIVYNGELYNTEELRKELVNMGFSFKSYSDTEVLLISFIAWGKECVKHINGIYAFGIWDEKKQALFLARDPLGVKPLFYTLKDNAIIFGSEIKALLANPNVEPVLDSKSICEIFGLGPARSLGCGVFKNVNEIPPAFYLWYDKYGLKLTEYWKLKSEPHTEDIDTTTEHLRYLVKDAVNRQLYADVPVCTFLSGGLDSSAISSIASEKFGSGNLNTYSIDYSGNNIYFKANEYQPTSDTEFSIKMSEIIKSNHHGIVLNNSDLAKALENAAIANDMPGMADIDSSLYLFCKEVRKDATVALSGECADEIFGGYPWYRRQEDINATTFPWSKAIDERKSLLSKDFYDLDMKGYVQSKYEDTLSQVPTLEGESASEHRMRELFFLNIKWFMITLLNRKDRMSMSNSLEVRVPFADYRLVEYAFNIPWSMKYCDNREKGILKRALKGIVPDMIINRTKSPYPKTHNPEYGDIVQNWMREILKDTSSPIHSIINEEKINEIVETCGKAFGKPWFGQLMTGPQLIAYLIQINFWLKEYKIRIE
jgi:asparagine synthase (glutamine-hydrolysing)